MVAVGGVSIFVDSDEDAGIVDTMEVSAFVQSNREPHTAPSSPVASSFTQVTRDDQDSNEECSEVYSTSDLCRSRMLCRVCLYLR